MTELNEILRNTPGDQIVHSTLHLVPPGSDESHILQVSLSADEWSRAVRIAADRKIRVRDVMYACQLAAGQLLNGCVKRDFVVATLDHLEEPKGGVPRDVGRARDIIEGYSSRSRRRDECIHR
jgi:hypothetical protein